MPKITDANGRAERLQVWIDRLSAGVEVSKRDVETLLGDERTKALHEEIEKHETLRKTHKARTREQQQALGIKNKRELRIEALEAAKQAAEDGVLNALKQKMKDAQVRQARIYFEKFGEVHDKTKDTQMAINQANNALTRAGLKRMDGQVIGHANSRDKEVWEMEEQIMDCLEAKMTDDEREQLALLRKHGEAVKKRNAKKR